ncbi:MAG: hypothetical protein ACK4QW_13680, partial [Alphaproteobacteria bacterium]
TSKIGNQATHFATAKDTGIWSPAEPVPGLGTFYLSDEAFHGIVLAAALKQGMAALRAHAGPLLRPMSAPQSDRVAGPTGIAGNSGIAGGTR